MPSGLTPTLRRQDLFDRSNRKEREEGAKDAEGALPLCRTSKPTTESVPMIKRLLIITIYAAFLLAAVSLLAQATSQPVVFAHISDTHLDTEQAVAHLTEFLADLSTIEPRPQFVLHTGDLTNLGTEKELKAYVDLVRGSPVPIYAVPGNHETRWSNIGKKRFERLIGPRYRHFSMGDIHFFGLDTSMLIEQYGHFDREQLRWLARELATLPAGATVIPFSHHPPLLGSYVDNAAELIQLLQDYNIPVFFTGHGHATRHWQISGIDFLMTEGLMDDDWGYRIVEITSDSVRVFLRSLADSTFVLDFTRPRQRRQPISINVVEPGTELPRSSSLEVVIEAADADNARFRLDRRDEFVPMEHVGGGRFTGSMSLDPRPSGRYRLEIEVVDRLGMPWRMWRPLRLSGGPMREAYRFETNGGIQSSPVVSEGKLVFGSNDGFVYSVDARSGVKRWRFYTGGPVLATPAVHGDVAFVGSVSGEMFALGVEDGQPRWQKRIAESIYSSASVFEDLVLVGASDSSLHAVRAVDGVPVWRFQTGGLVKARPLVHKGRVYFGSWDGYFYALKLEDGGLAWRQQISANPYFPAATSNPVLAGGLIVVASHDHVVHAFDPESGEEVWRHEKTDTHMPGYSTGLVHGSRIFFGSLSGHLFALDVATGETVFETQLGDPPDPIFDSSPTWTGSEVVVGSVGGRLYAVDAESGGLSWSYSFADGYIFSTPLTFEGRVYVGTLGGRMWALRVDGE
jgi:outer membrane protein assembly factor BamB/predicted phosphodiesterase